jgi:SAM-dependent methyltransferase
MHRQHRRVLGADLSPNEIRRLHDVLADQGYGEPGLADTLGSATLPTWRSPDCAYFRYLTRRGRPLDSLMRLFLLSIPVSLDEAHVALASPLDTWARAGLIAVDQNQARGLVRIVAFRNLLLACDALELQGSSAQLDGVIGVTDSTAALADFVIPRQSRATLDLGTGTGVLALLVAAHSQRVCGIDLSPRAIEFARFNAHLNACSTPIEFLEGDGFNPVCGRSFDLIVSNPPFILSPDCRYHYRDSGKPADSFVHRLIETAPDFLNEGGFCQLVCQWAHVAGEDWEERLAGWFAATGCDAWAMTVQVETAADYARTWITQTEHPDAEQSDRLFERWLAYYQQERIEAVSTGLITLQKVSGKKNWVRFEDSSARASGPFGADIALGFELNSLLETIASDEALLNCRLRVAPRVRLEHVCEWKDAAWHICSSKLRLQGGLQYESSIDLRVAGILARCDGRSTVREILDCTAATLSLDLHAIMPQCLGIARQLVKHGYLLPADSL